ncbi:MAG: NTP transferase domain-containing protein [Deltaproteobacteria bacterium]|nr:NTP transferase domain-containing protein [Deltaproteobacteria bacterium]
MITVALVLAAGRSRRMGQPKAWLTLDGEPLLGRVLRSALAGGVDQVVVVVGAEEGPAGLVTAKEVRAWLAASDRGDDARLRLAVGRPDGAPIDSIRAGLGLVPPGAAVLLWPVDQPFADAALVRSMRRALHDGAGRVVVPAVNGEDAHPVLLGPEVVAELQAPPADRGARAVTHRLADRILRIPATDPRLIEPLNTPAQATKMGARLDPDTPSGTPRAV